MSKKIIVVITAVPILLLIFGALWMNYTHQGRVFGLYAFAAFKTPLDIKMRCIEETNDRVYEKFLLPLAFDEESKNALREYWHFSYYRQCLFKAGYDFYGAPIPPTELTAVNDTYVYKNHFTDISFTTATTTSIVYDNTTDPDNDDYTVGSQLLIGSETVTVNFDRSYKVKDLAALEPIFAGFVEKIDFTSPTLVKLPSPRPDILAFENTDQFGYVLIIPDNHIITIYGKNSARSTIESLVDSITIIE